MAYVYGTPGADPQDQSPALVKTVSTFTSIAGAAVSLALIVGVGVWGYKLMVRDVSGIPVVRAVQGDMRVRPEEPGGRPASHQGLSVNAVAAEGAAEAPADRLVLAPQAAELSEEDAPVTALLRATEPEATQFNSDATVDALVAELTRGVKPLDSTTQEAVVTQAAARIEHPKPIAEPLDAPGLRISLRPQKRPANATANVVQASLAPEARIDANALPAGTKLAQLGAYDSPETAAAEWDKKHRRFSEVMEGKQMVVQRASSGGRTFYRLRAHGFADMSDARRFCSALVAENTDCIPVTTK